MLEKQDQGSGMFLRGLIEYLPSMGSIIVLGRWRQEDQKTTAILGYIGVEASLVYTRPCLTQYTWGGGQASERPLF